MSNDDEQQGKPPHKWPAKFKEHNYQVIKVKRPKKERISEPIRIKIK